MRGSYDMRCCIRRVLLCGGYSSEGEELLSAEGGSWKRWWMKLFMALAEEVLIRPPSWQEAEEVRWSRFFLSICVHCVLRGLAVQCSSHTTQWCIWSGCSGWGSSCLAEEGSYFLKSNIVLAVQMRSSLMCTPRNLLLTLSTAALLMVSGMGGRCLWGKP